ncbi:MAG: hypothetical protein SOZ34_07270 [Clostridia bacterium]|nr:hypothetical protein [Clostridia bacterium]
MEIEMKKKLYVFCLFVFVLICTISSGFAAEHSTTARYYLENNKITLLTSFSGYEEGTQLSYMVTDADGNVLYYNQITAGESVERVLYSVPDANIEDAVISVNDGSGFDSKPLGISRGNTVTFNMADGTYAVCTAENGRVKTINNGSIKLAEGETVSIKPESDGESEISAVKVNGADADNAVLSIIGNGSDIEISTEAVKKERNILRASDDVKPGSLFNIYGENFNTDNIEVYIENVAENSDLPGKNSYKADIINVDEESGNFITVRMPKECEGGQYSLWVKNNNSFSRPHTVNAARPQWLQQVKTAKGQTNKIIGRCLMPESFGSDNKVSVKLENASGEYYPDIISSDSYSIEFAVNENIPAGSYSVSVSNGDNIWSELEYTEYGTMLEIIEAVNDPLGLNVWWAGEFNYDNVVTVSGNTDNDIQNAILSAYKSGGGVVYLPEGTYSVSHLDLYDGVILKGDGADKTILDTDGSSWIIIRGGHISEKSDDGLQGIYGLTVRMTDDTAANASVYPDSIIHLQGKIKPGMSKVFIKDCNVDFPIADNDNIESDKLGRRIPFFVSCGSDVVIDGCTSVSKHGGMYVNTKLRTRITNNTCAGVTGSIYGIGECVTFENNIANGAGLPVKSGQHEGIIARGPCYINGNRINNVGIDGMNDGETILAESAGAYTKMAGNIVSAGSNYAVVDGEIRNWDMNDQKWGSWQIIIADGKGLGQILPIESMDEETKTIRLYKGWDIVPDETSKFIVTTAIKSMTITDNYTSNSKKGIWLYNGCSDCVVANNTVEDCQGIYVRGFANKLSEENEDGTVSTYTNFWPSYFNTVRNNNVSGVSRLTNESSIGSIAVIGGGKNPVFGILTYGSEVRENTLDAQNRTNITGGAENALVDGIYLGHHSVQVVNGNTAYKGAIAEDNTVRNAHTGISAGGDVYENLARNTLSLRSDLSKGVVLSGNSFENVDEKYSFNTYDGTKYKTASVKTVLSVQEKIGTNPEPVITIGDEIISEIANDIMKVTFEVKNICSESDISVYAAVYDNNGKLYCVSGQNKNVEKNNTDKFDISLDLSECQSTENYTLKIFVWNGEKMYPLCSEPFSK